MPPAYSKPVLKEEMVITLELLAQYLKAANLLTAIPAWPYDGSHYSMHPPPALHPAENRLFGVPGLAACLQDWAIPMRGRTLYTCWSTRGPRGELRRSTGRACCGCQIAICDQLVRACQQGGISTSAHPLRIRYRAHAAWWAAARHWRPVAGVPKSAILRLCVGSHTPQPTVSLEISLSVVRI